MATERTIRFTTELDTSGMLTGLNKIKQDLSSMNVDQKMFKAVYSDIDKIQKILPVIINGLKNGVPENGINKYLKNVELVTQLWQTLPQKIKQVDINTKNINLSGEIIKQLDEINIKIEDTKTKIQDVIGKNLQNALNQQIGGQVSKGVLKEIADVDNGINKFKDHIETTKSKALGLRNALLTAFQAIKDNKSGLIAKDGADLLGFGEKATKALNNKNYDSFMISQKMVEQLKGLSTELPTVTKNYGDLNTKINDFINLLMKVKELNALKPTVKQTISSAETERSNLEIRQRELEAQKVRIITAEEQRLLEIRNRAGAAAETVGKRSVSALNELSNSAQRSNAALQKQDSILRQLYQRATMLIGIGAIFNYITRAVRSAWNGIKELDKEFTQIAVVTSNTTSQLWASFSTYSQMAQRLGVATKDAVATSALYYQQGLKTNDVMSLTTETIKMARIAGMDFATATNQMTAAIRGFNLEMNQASLVNDIFSTLAANAAVSTQELSYALTKTASIADSAGMSIENTSAFLTKMIETTREAPKQKLAA